MKKQSIKLYITEFHNHIKMFIDKDRSNRYQELKSDDLWVVDEQVIIFLLFSTV